MGSEFANVSFDDIEKESNEFANVDWSSDTGEEQVASKPLSEVVFDGMKEGVSDIGDWMMGKGRTMDLFRSAASTALTVPSRMTEMALGLGEDIEYGVRGGMQQALGQEVDPPVHAASEYVGGAADNFERMVQPSEMDSPNKIASRVGEYAGFSGLVTEKAIHAGKKLLKEAPKNATFIEKMLMDSAKNPAGARMLDQKISAVMAVAGGASMEVLDTSPTTTLVIEMLAGLSTAKVIQVGGKVKDGLNRLLKDTDNLASRGAGKYLADVEAEQAGFQKTLEEGDKLSQKYGVEMDIAEMSNNSELKSAKKHLTEDSQGGVTREVQRQARQESQVRSAFTVDEQAIQKGQNSARQDIDDIEKTLQTNVDNAEIAAKKEALKYEGLDATQSGSNILHKIDDAEDVFDASIKVAYEKIGLDVPIGDDIILSSIREAKKTRLKGNEWKGELDSQLKKIFDGLQGFTGEKAKEYGTTKKFRLGANSQQKPDLTIGAIQELQGRLKQEIRVARSQGKNPLVRSLAKVLDGTFKQLDNATGLSANSVKDLKDANKLAKESFDRFDNARVDVLTRVDSQGVTKTAPEDIVRNVVKSNSALNVERSVTSVTDAIGDSAQSKELLRDAFMSKMALKIVNDGALSVKSADDFIRSHSKFLKKSGLDVEFKDPAKRQRAFEESMSNMQDEVSALGKSELAKWFKSDDPTKFVMAALRSGKLKHIVANSKPIIQRAIKETVWDGILKDANIKNGLSGFEKSIDNSSLSTLLQKNKTDLEKTLGGEHFGYVEDLFGIIKRIETNPSSTAGFVTKKGMPDLTEKLLTGLRAAAHGFVRPELIATQAAKRGWEAKALKESKKLLKEALINKEAAKNLMKIYRRSPTGKQFVRTTLSPYAASFSANQE